MWSRLELTWVEQSQYSSPCCRLYQIINKAKKFLVLKHVILFFQVINDITNGNNILITFILSIFILFLVDSPEK